MGSMLTVLACKTACCCYGLSAWAQVCQTMHQTPACWFHTLLRHSCSDWHSKDRSHGSAQCQPERSTCCCHNTRQTSCQCDRTCLRELLLHCCRQLLQVVLCDVAQRRAQHTVHTKAYIRTNVDEAQHEHPRVLRTPAHWQPRMVDRQTGKRERQVCEQRGVLL